MRWLALGLVVAGCGGTHTIEAPPTPTSTVEAEAPVAVAFGGVDSLSCPGQQDAATTPRNPDAPPADCPALPAPNGHVLVPQLGVTNTWRLTPSPDGSTFVVQLDAGLGVFDAETAQLRAVIRTATRASIGYHPQGKVVAASCGQKRAHLFDLEEGRTKALFTTDDRFFHLSFDPTGEVIAAQHQDGISLWTGTGNPIATLGTGTAAITFSPDGGILASYIHNAFDPQRLTLWDAKTGKRLWQRDDPYVGQGAGYASWRPDGKAIAWLPDARTVEIVDPSSGQVVKRLSAPSSDLSRVAFSSGGRVVATGSNGHLWVWDAQGGRASPAGRDCRTCRFELSPNAEQVLISRYRNPGPVRLSVLSLEPGASERPLRMPFDPGHFHTWLDERHVAVGSTHRRTPAVIDLKTQKVAARIGEVSQPWAIAWSPDGTRLAATYKGHGPSAWENVIQVWDAHRGAIGSTIAGRRRGKGDSYDGYTDLHHSSEFIAAVSMRHVDLYEPGGRFVRTVEARAKHATPQTAAFSPDGRRLAVIAARMPNVRVYDPRVGIVGEHPTGIGVPWAVAFSPNRKLLALSSNTHLAVLAADSGKRRAMFEGTRRIANAIEWLDDSTFVSGHEDGTLMHVELGTTAAKEKVTPYRAHPRSVKTLSVSADRELLATGGGSGAVKIWRLSSMELVATHRFDTRGIKQVQWHPTAPVLAIVAEGPIRLLRMPDNTWIDLHLVAMESRRHGLALTPGNLFGGDEEAFFYVGWLDAQHRVTAPLQWYDAFEEYRRKTLGRDLLRGCALLR